MINQLEIDVNESRQSLLNYKTSFQEEATAFQQKADKDRDSTLLSVQVC